MKIYEDSVQEEMILKEIVEYTLKLVKNYKKKYLASVSIHKTNGINLTVRSGILDYLEFNNDTVLTITVYYNNRKSMVSSTDLNLSSIKIAVDTAIQIVEYISKDLCHTLPNYNLLAMYQHNLKLSYPCLLSIKEVVFITKQIEEFSLQEDSRIIHSEGSSFFSHIHTIVLGNTLHMLNSYKTSIHSFSISVVARDYKIMDGMEREYYYTTSRKFNNLISPIIMGKIVSNKAISKLGSKKIFTKKTPILFDSEVSASIFSHFMYSIQGSNVYRKNTILLNAMNTAVFPIWLSIIDNPKLEEGLGSKPFDLEGVMTKKHTIVERGILKTWLLDTYFSNKLNLTSTGHSGGIHNWLILGQSSVDISNLCKIMHRGVYITELMGDGVNIMTGTYSRGASGFWIDNGKIQYPINEITISGNLKDMWKNIVMIGNDTDMRKRIQCGSILISDIQISGK
ncbi:Metalloprotease PmbA [Buchnera aphidicola (Eriosoma lanigerum)]|uniref:metalloprotease PmbA n=1 Tax=Buchnera aphidicola TaxID=9 RepID=UPI003463ED78